MGKKYYSVSMYAKLVGKTPMTIYNRIKGGKLDFIEAIIGSGNKKTYLVEIDDDKEDIQINNLKGNNEFYIDRND